MHNINYELVLTSHFMCGRFTVGEIIFLSSGCRFVSFLSVFRVLCVLLAWFTRPSCILYFYLSIFLSPYFCTTPLNNKKVKSFIYFRSCTSPLIDSSRPALIKKEKKPAKRKSKGLSYFKLVNRIRLYLPFRQLIFILRVSSH